MKSKIDKTLLIVAITMTMAASASAQTDLTGLFDGYSTDDLFVNATDSTAVIVDRLGRMDNSFAVDSYYDSELLDTQVKDNVIVNSKNTTLLPEPTTVMMLGIGGLVFIRKK